MSENPEKKGIKTKPEETEEPISPQEESGSSEKAQVEQMETTERFDEKIINKVKDIEMGAIFTGMEDLFNSAKKMDAKITMNAGGLFSRVTGYFRNSIDSYNKTRK